MTRHPRGDSVSITIRDVAQRAGVSVTTVSRALNGTGPVSEEARRRVEAASAELRYLPHGTARSLITRRTDVFGAELAACLAPDVPVVLLNCDVRGTDFPAINVDNYGGALEMVRHLIAL